MNEKNDFEELTDMMMNNVASQKFENQGNKVEVFPDCVNLFNSFSRCMGGTNQIEHLYKYKSLENCNAIWVDSRKCLQAKLSTNDKVKQVEFFISSFHRGLTYCPTETL